MSEIKLTLPPPPSANRYWRKWRNSIVKSSEAKNYIETVRKIALAAGVRQTGGLKVLTMRVYRARKAGDLDNKIKILADALQGVCYADDKQIVEIHAYRFDDKKSPRVEVEIKEIKSGKTAA